MFVMSPARGLRYGFAHQYPRLKRVIYLGKVGSMGDVVWVYQLIIDGFLTYVTLDSKTIDGVWKEQTRYYPTSEYKVRSEPMTADEYRRFLSTLPIEVRG